MFGYPRKWYVWFFAFSFSLYSFGFRLWLLCTNCNDDSISKLQSLEYSIFEKKENVQRCFQWERCIASSEKELKIEICIMTWILSPEIRQQTLKIGVNLYHWDRLVCKCQTPWILLEHSRFIDSYLLPFGRLYDRCIYWSGYLLDDNQSGLLSFIIIPLTRHSLTFWRLKVRKPEPRETDNQLQQIDEECQKDTLSIWNKVEGDV
jgi:hypothetical protein